MSEIALSTMWAKRYSRLDKFVRDVREFDFTQVELSCILTEEKLQELLNLGVKVSSIHFPCPVPTSHPGELSSLDEEERRKAVSFSRETIELASQVGAKVVVIHAGRVEMDFKLEDKLHQLYEQGDLKEFERVKQRLFRERASRAEPHFQAARGSLLELADFAEVKRIKLGLETRFYFHEIPQFEEMERLLQELPPGSVGYWHDVGHAEVKSRLGLIPHQKWFDFKNRLIGIHLHDVLGIQDHRAPGTGDVDWGFVARNLPPSAVKVCEIGEWNSWKACAQAVTFLESQGIIL